MRVTHSIDEYEIADYLAGHGGFAINVFAHLAVMAVDDGALVGDIAAGYSGSQWHANVSGFLRQLADGIDAAEKAET